MRAQVAAAFIAATQALGEPKPGPEVGTPVTGELPTGSFREAARADILKRATNLSLDRAGIKITSDIPLSDLEKRGIKITEVKEGNDVLLISVGRTNEMLVDKSTASISIADNKGNTSFTVVDHPTEYKVQRTQTIVMNPEGDVVSSKSVEAATRAQVQEILVNVSPQDLSKLGINISYSKGLAGGMWITMPEKGSATVKAGSIVAITREQSDDAQSMPSFQIFGPQDKETGARVLTQLDPVEGKETVIGTLSPEEVKRKIETLTQ